MRWRPRSREATGAGCGDEDEGTTSPSFGAGYDDDPRADGDVSFVIWARGASVAWRGFSVSAWSLPVPFSEIRLQSMLT